jgi:DHA2 family methylenomycin A resistance protein-like MFS transporter
MSTVAQPGRLTGRGRWPAAESGRPRLVVAAALLGFFMMALDATAVNVALPGIGRNLGGATAALQWVADGYTLMFAALLISAGAISDRIGARRVFGLGLAAFVTASAACGLAPAMWFLIAARVVQGSAAALALPASLALIRQAFDDPSRRARAVAQWAAGGALAIVAGPVAGGMLTSAVSWRAIFFINLPVGIAVLALLTRAPRSPRRDTPLDLPGQVTAVLALAALTSGVIEGGAGGFGRPLVLGCLLLAALAIGTFLLVEARAAAPMVPLGLFRSRTVTVCVAVGFTINVAFYGAVFVYSLFFQQVLGLSALGAGLLFLPMTALVSSANLGSARAAARFGPRLPIWAGQLVAALGTLGLVTVGATTDRYLIAVILIPVGIGLGFAVPSLTAMLLEALPSAQAGLAAGVLNSGRQVGGTVAVAVFGALVAHRTSFGAGVRESMLIVAVMLAGSTLAALRLPRLPVLRLRPVAAGAADPLGLGGGEGPLQRFPGGGQILLGQRDEQAVDHGQLRDPARHGAGPESGLARRGEQDEVGDLGDRGPREIRHRDRGGAVIAGLAEHVDRVHGGAGVRQADRDVALIAEGGRRDGHVRIRPGERGLADPLQFHLQVQGDKPAGAHAINIDPLSSGERFHHALEGRDVDMARGVRDRLGIGVGDLLRDRRRVVVRVDLRGNRYPRTAILGDGTGQRQAQFRVPAQADRPAEADHAGGGRAAGTGQLGNVPPGDAGRVVEDGLRYPALHRREVRQQRPDGDEDAEVRSPVLMFGHPARLPFFALKSAAVAGCLEHGAR